MKVPEEKKFKILSIDGGGIKGLFSSTILEQFEEKYQCCISDHFDMLCGTSTGGLIALALSLRIPAKEISSLYMENGNIIFRKNMLSRIKQLIYKGKYSDNNLKSILNSLFQDKIIADSHNLLCIPAYNFTDGNTCVFKYDHKEGKLSRDNKIKYTEIALATSAAPTYFPISDIRQLNKQYIDGGLWANNPTLVGLIEALCHFVGPNKEYQSVQILSIASLDDHKGNPLSRNNSSSFFKLKRGLIDPFFAGQYSFTHNSLKLLQSHSDLNINYTRIPSAKLNAKQLKQVGMDKTSEECLRFIQGQGQTTATNWYNKAIIRELFTKKKTYILKS